MDRYANLDFQDKAVITDYLHNLQLSYLEMLGYRPLSSIKNRELPLTKEIKEFRLNYKLQSKLLNEIYFVSLWIQGEVIDNKFYPDIEKEEPTILE